MGLYGVPLFMSLRDFGLGTILAYVFSLCVIVRTL